MANNIGINEGGDKELATEERSSVHYPRNLRSGYSSGGHGSKITVAAGTPVQISSSSVPCSLVRICGFEGNTNPVVIGFSNSVRAGSSGGAPAGTRTGDAVFPAGSKDFPVSDLNLLWLDSVVSGEGVHYAYFV